jgi:hypothetical protein
MIGARLHVPMDNGLVKESDRRASPAGTKESPTSMVTWSETEMRL